MEEEQLQEREHLEKHKMEVDMKGMTNKEGQSTRLALTGLINLSFLFSIGLIDGIKGPVLLDLKELYETSVKTMSFMFMISSLGSLFGSFFTGYIMGKFPFHQSLVMFFYLTAFSLFTFMFPFAGNLYLFFIITFLHGFIGAAIDTGGNVMCLQIWRGRNGGPYIHSIHFSFAMGATLAPLVAAPFLSLKATESSEESEMPLLTNTSSIQEGGSSTQIHYLFPILSVCPVLVSLGFLYFSIKSMRESRTTANRGPVDDAIKCDAEPKKTRWSIKMVSLVGLLSIFFFLYVGIEYSIGIYLTTFAVKCRLQLTKVQGTNLTAIFWGCFATMRFLAIFAAIKINPLNIMIFSFVSSVISSMVLVFYAESSLILLQVCVGALGFGMASIYATGLLWLEQFITVTSYIGALFTIASSAGPDVCPILIGQFIVDFPMFLFYLNLGIVLACILIFFLASIFGMALKSESTMISSTSGTVDEPPGLIESS